MLTSLKTKKVLITGASTGIGAAVARAFGQLGASVAVHFHASADSAQAVADDIRAAGGQAVLIRADLTQSDAATQMVAEAVEALGGLDILFNNAGSLCGRRPIIDVDDALYETVMTLNVTSVLKASQAAAPHLQAAGGGAIINVGSIAGSDGGGPGSGHYACAKGYVHTLTRHMARDFASRNIRVNAIAPGVIATPFHAQTPAERMEAMQKAVPMGRVGTPEDCVGPVLFLASDMSAYVTGQILHVNGGQLMA